jgi:hypothetical protein
MSDGSVLLNEVAPRPHNTGHYTIEASDCCQFENHMRAVMGLPLGSTKCVLLFTVKCEASWIYICLWCIRVLKLSRVSGCTFGSCCIHQTVLKDKHRVNILEALWCFALHGRALFFSASAFHMMSVLYDVSSNLIAG